jgi:hypothetical protein
MCFYSVGLFFLNLLLIYLCALFIFWIKKIRPPLPDPALERFLEFESPTQVNGDERDDDIPLLRTKSTDLY